MRQTGTRQRRSHSSQCHVYGSLTDTVTASTNCRR
jgi:hypothetical protein